MPNIVYRIYTDGRPPELVRGVDLIGTPLAAFGKIIAAEQRHRRLQRHVRRRKRQRAGLGLVARRCWSARSRCRRKRSRRKRCRSCRRPSRGGSPDVRQIARRCSACAARPSARLCCAGRSRSAPGVADLMAAMQDELQRSMSGLRIEGRARAVLHRVSGRRDGHRADCRAARRDRRVNESGSRVRTLRVDVRVGDYAVRQLAVRRRRAAAASRRPTAARPRARRRLRRDAPADVAGDRRRLQARRQHVRAEEGGVPEPGQRRRRCPTSRARRRSNTMLPPRRARPAATGDGPIGSAIFGGVRDPAPTLHSSAVSVTEQRGTRYYLNSEGFKVVTPIEDASLLRQRRRAGRRRHDTPRHLRHGRRTLEDLPPVAD